VSAAWWQVLAGFGLDLLFGDPQWFPHPVRGFGWFAVRLERLARSIQIPLRVGGLFFWMTAVSAAGLLVWATTPWLNIFWIWTLLAIRDLDFEAARVLRNLQRGDLSSARASLAMIVGRDTESLDEPEILRGVIETVAENLSDAIVAPLFYLAIAGPVGMAVYKAINTLDSMVGYRDDRYREFGWAAARMDDVVNYVPARLTAILIWICATLLRYDVRQSWKITLRDGASQPSPNAGYPEAAVAGALGIQLGGLNYYAGVPSAKPYIGDARRPLTIQTFTQARALLYGTSALMVAAVCAVVR
jgi:adenosylcobinamide-phosphate synthase